MYTSGEVADELAVPPSTLRLYVKRAGKLLSKAARSKSGRRFSALDLEKLRQLRELLRGGERFDVALTKVDQTVDASGTSDELPAEIDRSKSYALLVEAVASIQAQSAELAAQGAQLAEQGDALDEAKRELAVIKAWLALPAWRRLLTTPNLNKPPA